MEPTLQDWDWMVVRSIGYTPRQGDVVVLSKEFDDVEGPIVKRIVAVSGQRVDIDYAAGAVSVDGRALEEDYILEPMTQRHWQTVTSLTVPEGCMFVMGDNRTGSNDSRLLGEPYIPIEAVQARMLVAISVGSDQSWQGVRWIG